MQWEFNGTPQADKKWISHPNVLLLQTVKARFSGTRVSIAVCACCASKQHGLQLLLQLSQFALHH